MAQSNRGWSFGSAKFIDDRENAPLVHIHEVYRYEEGIVQIQGQSEADIKTTFGKLESTFDKTVTPAFSVDPENVEATDDRIVAAIEAEEKLIVVVGYYLPGLGKLGKTNSDEKKKSDGKKDLTIKASENEYKVFLAGYKIGSHGKSAKPFALVNPNEDGVCGIMNIPGGKASIFFRSPFINEEDSKKQRERTVGKGIGRIVNPLEHEKEAEQRVTTKAKESLAHMSTLYQAIPEETFSLKARLARFAARLEISTSEELSLATDILAEAKSLGIGHPGTTANHYIVQLGCVAEKFELTTAKLALHQIKNLWPDIFKVPKVAAALDHDLLFAVGYALRHQLRASVVLEYESVKTFLVLVVVLDHEGQNFKKGSNSSAWGEHVKAASDVATCLVPPAIPAKEYHGQGTMKRSAVLSMVKEDLKSLRRLLKDSAVSVNQHAARIFNYGQTPRLMTLHDALHKLANCHEHNAAFGYIEAIYRNIGQQYGEVYGGVVLRAVRAMEGHIDELQTVEDDDDDGEQQDEEVQDGQ